MSGKPELDGAKPGKPRAFRNTKRTVAILGIVAIIAISTISFTVFTSSKNVSKRAIICVNKSPERDLLFQVEVHGAERGQVILGPNESFSFTWNVTGWLHRYFCIALPPGTEVHYFVDWTIVVVYPFSEKIIHLERQHL